MQVFAQLRALAEFRAHDLPFLQTMEDFDLVREIGHHQVLGAPIVLKQLLVLGVGSVATVQRRLQRLKRLDVVRQRRSEIDRRVVELTLSPGCMKAFAGYGSLLSGQRPGLKGGKGLPNGQVSHLCVLCDGDAGCSAVAVPFLREGLQRRQICVLVGSQAFRAAALAELERAARKRPSPAQVLELGGEKSLDTLLETFHRIFRDAKEAGKTVRLVDNMSWMLGKADFPAIMDYEERADPLLRRYQVRALCQYDVRRFPGPHLLRALKVHPDTNRYPLLLG